MLDTFITSFRLKNTYRTNTIIYSIRCLPIIGKLLPASLYGSGGLKTFANVISVLWEIAGTFIGKILYMLLMIMLLMLAATMLRQMIPLINGNSISAYCNTEPF